ncbi:MAG: translocation/assembly module TamB domain-containing protein [Candidatus Marinimicrobia bacterium]|nr:translocation/assembly module TamB domain-containing protein [Candidatus Neomarinimicrobiota bacterium]
MFKIALWILIFLFFIASGAAFLLLNTQYWRSRVLSYINKQVEKRYGLVCNSSRLIGNIFSNLHFEDFKISTKSDVELFRSSDLDIRYRIFSLLGKRPEIRSISIDSFSFSYPGSIDTLVEILKNAPNRDKGGIFNLRQIDIRNLNVVDSNKPENTILFSRLIYGKISLCPDSINIVADTAYIKFENINEDISLSNAELLLIGDSLVISGSTIRNRSTVGEICGFLNLDSSHAGELKIKFDNIVFADRFTGLGSIFDKNDYVDLDGCLKSIRDVIETDFEFCGKLRGRDITDGQLLAKIQNGKFDIKSLSFNSGEESIRGNINGDFDTGLLAEIDLNKLNLKNWGVFNSNTLLTGSLSLDVEGIKNKPTKIITSIKINNSRIDTLNFDQIAGELIYEDRHITISDTIFMKLYESILQLTGECDLNTNTINARSYLNSRDVSIFSSLLNIDTLNGAIEAFVEATGNIHNPDFRGWIKGDQFGIPQLSFDESIARFGMVNIGKKHFGDIYIESVDGKSSVIRGPIPLASLIVRFEGDTAYVRSLRVTGKDLNVEVQGSMVKFKDFYFDKIKVALEGNVFKNLEPIHFSWEEDTIKLDEVDFSLNQGEVRASGRVVNRKLQLASMDFANLNIDPLNALLRGSQGISGIIDGNVEYVSPNGSSSLKGKIDIKDISFIGQDFNNAHLEVVVEDNKLLISNFIIQDVDNGVASCKGYVSCHFPPEKDKPFICANDTIDIQIDFNNFLFSSFSSFVLPRIQKEGKLSGDVSIQNCTGNPLLIFNLAVNDPTFDKLVGNELIARGFYRKSKLMFNDLILKDSDGIYKGYGYLPFNVSIVPVKVTFGRDSVMSMNFSGHTTALSFLTNYIGDLDDARGEFDLALSLSGTPKKPIRSGNFSAKSGVLDISSLENTITGLEGSGVMNNNSMDIISLTGFMLKPQPRTKFEEVKDKLKSLTWDVLFPPKLAGNEPNLSITGKVDFTKFFQPGFNVRLIGEDLYIRTLLAEQEGIVSGVFTMTGRDSILIEGDVDISEFIIRNEFIKTEQLLKEVKPSGVYTSINIHAAIPGNLYFRNSQLDGELEGEMWIIKNGDEPFRFSGDLDVRKGKFLYYGWEFLIERGSIIFDPTEFNPKLDIEAKVDLGSYVYQDSEESQTDRESEYAMVRLTGDLEQPVLTFESENCTQSDILMFLTRAKRASDDFYNPEKFSSDALNIFGAYFERQVEKNVSRIIGLNAFELRTKSNILSDLQPDQWSMILGQKVARNLYVTYERNLSLIEPNQQVGIEYRLNRNMSIVGDVDQDGLINIKYKYKYHY